MQVYNEIHLTTQDKVSQRLKIGIAPFQVHVEVTSSVCM